MPTTTHGGIGCTLSLNTSSPPFKVMLTLPNLRVVLHDSCDTKTDMQPESLKSFVTYSTTHTAMSAHERECDQQLAQGKPFNPSIRSLSVCLPQSTQLLSGICSQALSPQAFQTLPAATCSPAVNSCFSGFLCSRIISRYTAFLSLSLSLANQFLQHFVLGCLGPLAPSG